MEQIFVFFISLLLSIMFIDVTAVDFANKNSDNQNIRVILMFLVCVLWSLFYYLNK